MKFLNASNWSKPIKPTNKTGSYSRCVEGTVDKTHMRVVMKHGDPLNLTFELWGAEPVAKKGKKDDAKEPMWVKLPYTDDNSLRDLYKELCVVIRQDVLDKVTIRDSILEKLSLKILGDVS